jgi:predicted anti-sigma-YlaC factor YlaD
MKCKDVRTKLPDYLEGGTLPGMQAVAEHLAECEACRDFSIVVSDALHTLESEKLTEYDPFLFTRIQAGIENKRSRNRLGPVRFPARQLAYAMVFFFLVVAGIGLGRLFSNQQALATDYKTEIYYLQDDQSYLQASLSSE